MAVELPTLRVAVAAGKGGTGKTLLSTSLAMVANDVAPGQVRLLDCDVEEPNAHLLLRPNISAEEPVTVPVPQVDLEKCTRCGRCAEVCQNSAIAVIRDAVLVFPRLCSGCGACSYACPEGAIEETPRQVGVVRSGQTEGGIEFHGGLLNVDEERATPVTRAVAAKAVRDKLTIMDAPPGTACPMQETVEDADFCILVTEPTPFGLANLQEAVGVCRVLGVGFGVVINRHGSGYDGVERWCEAEGIPIMATFPEDRRVAEAYSRGQPAFAQIDEYRRKVAELLEQVVSIHEGGRGKW